jgi:tetratricopeptide (TPR) repeat protein
MSRGFQLALVSFLFISLMMALGGVYSWPAVQCIENPLGELDVIEPCEATVALAHVPSHFKAAAYLKLADAYGVGKPVEALSAAENALRLNPDSPISKEKLGQFYMFVAGWHERRQESGVALLYYDKTLAIDPENFGALRKRAFNHFVLKNCPQAIADYSALIKVEPIPAAYHNRGYCYEQTGNLRDAITDYSYALNMQPDFLSALERRAYAYYETRDFTAAVEDAENALQIDSRKVFPHTIKIRALVGLKRSDEALKALNDAELMAGENAYFSFVRAMFSERRRAYREAVSELDRAVVLAPNYGAAFAQRAWIKWQYLNDLEGALADYKIAAKLGEKVSEKQRAINHKLRSPQPDTPARPFNSRSFER